MTTARSLRIAAALLALVFACAAHSAYAAPSTREWRFTAVLDGRPIGRHRFVLETGEGGVRTLTSDARFDVTLLGLTIYRYRHHARERWQGDCLVGLTSHTDDDGHVIDVRAHAGETGFQVQTTSRGHAPVHTTATDCAMSFAYWNPALRTQHRLIDPASGKFEAVRIAPLPQTTIEVLGRPTVARGWRIGGLVEPVDFWFADGQWVGLDTVVAQDRHLSYRAE